MITEKLLMKNPVCVFCADVDVDHGAREELMELLLMCDFTWHIGELDN